MYEKVVKGVYVVFVSKKEMVDVILFVIGFEVSLVVEV